MSGNRAGGLKSAEINRSRDPEYYKKLGAKGGVAGDKKKGVERVKELYGDDFYSRAGKKGAEIRKMKREKLSTGKPQKLKRKWFFFK